MIDKLRIKNYRGIKDLEFSKLGRINIISGRNNVGKSSVLEGIFLMMDYRSPDSTDKISNLRRLPISNDPKELWLPMFRNLDANTIMEISAQIGGNEVKVEYSLDDSFVPTNRVGISEEAFNQCVSSAKATYTMKMVYSQKDIIDEGHFIITPNHIYVNMHGAGVSEEQVKMPNTQFINASVAFTDQSMINWFSDMEIAGRKQEVIEILKVIEPSISDIFAAVKNNRPQLYIVANGQRLPLNLAGDGTIRLLFITLAIVANRNSIILIDEIETGFHYSMYSKLWESIATVAKKSDSQIIATTHSYECIVGAVAGLDEAGMSNELQYYRLDRCDGENMAFGYKGDLIRYAIEENMEVR